jgi:pimeloyl-ACP methyl ester carboxylesterase
MTRLVLLPGMDGTGLLFSDFVAALGEPVKPIAVAYPTDQVLDYVQLEAYAREYLPASEPFVLLGESFSGPLAISIAAQPPQNLLGLILCCSFARNPRPALVALRPFTWLMPALKSATLASPILFGKHSTPALRDQLSTALAQVSSIVMQARLRAVLDIDVTEPLKQVRMPILYLCATDDRSVPQSASALISSIAPQTRVVSVDGPHMLLQVAAGATASIVGDFFKQCIVNDLAISAPATPATTPP